MSTLGWALVQYDWFPYKRGKEIWTHAEREDDVKKQQREMGTDKPRREAGTDPSLAALTRTRPRPP